MLQSRAVLGESVTSRSPCFITGLVVSFGAIDYSGMSLSLAKALFAVFELAILLQ